MTGRGPRRRVVLGCLAAAPPGAQVEPPPPAAAAALRALTLQAVWRLLLAARAEGAPAPAPPSPARRLAHARAQVTTRSHHFQPDLNVSQHIMYSVGASVRHFGTSKSTAKYIDSRKHQSWKGEPNIFLWHHMKSSRNSDHV